MTRLTRVLKGSILALGILCGQKLTICSLASTRRLVTFQLGNSTFHRHPDPATEAFLGALAVGVNPHLFERIFQHVHHCKVTVGRQYFLEVRTPIGAEIFRLSAVWSGSQRAQGRAGPGSAGGH